MNQWHFASWRIVELQNALKVASLLWHVRVLSVWLKIKHYPYVRRLYPTRPASAIPCRTRFTYFFHDAEIAVSKTPLLGLCQSSTIIVATSDILLLATLLLTLVSGINDWKVFSLKSCQRDSVASRGKSVIGPAIIRCCQLEKKLGASCVPHVIHSNDVSSVKTWGRLTMQKIWCPSALCFALSKPLLHKNLSTYRHCNPVF
jgi:hypothetical protein